MDTHTYVYMYVYTYIHARPKYSNITSSEIDSLMKISVKTYNVQEIVSYFWGNLTPIQALEYFFLQKATEKGNLTSQSLVHYCEKAEMLLHFLLAYHL